MKSTCTRSRPLAGTFSSAYLQIHSTCYRSLHSTCERRRTVWQYMIAIGKDDIFVSLNRHTFWQLVSFIARLWCMQQFGSISRIFESCSQKLNGLRRYISDQLVYYFSHGRLVKLVKESCQSNIRCRFYSSLRNQVYSN